MFFRKNKEQKERTVQPEIQEEDLCESIRTVHFKMLTAFRNKKVDDVSDLLSDGFSDKMVDCLEDFQKKKKTNYTEKSEILSVQITDKYQKENKDYVVCEVLVSGYNYALDDVQGKLLAGDRDKKRFAVFEYLLERPQEEQPYENGLGFLISSIKRSEKRL